MILNHNNDKRYNDKGYIHSHDNQSNKNTLSVTKQMLIEHGKAVVNNTRRALIVVDLPFGTYQKSPDQAYETASLVIKETRCDAHHSSNNSI